MRKVILLIYLLLVLSPLEGQDGAPILTQFGFSREIENQSWAICQDENRVMLFANRKGILSFDGLDWSPLEIPIIPFSIQMNPHDKRIYIGGENNYGYIEKNLIGSYRYESLSGDSTDLGLITKIIFNDSLVWFYGEKTLSCYNFKTSKLQLRLNSKPGIPFTGMFLTSKNAYINVSNRGLCQLEGDTLIPIVSSYLTKKIDILFSLPYDQKMVLVGFSNSRLSLFDGIKYYDYQIQDDGYIRDNILSEGINIGDSLYAFSTLGGGAVVLDKVSGKVRFTINNENGLPDDEIFAIAYDKSGGLWLSHQYGLTRADLNLPVGNFSIYKGLKGNLTTALRHNNELYVATSEGVFYLAEEKNYSEVEILIKNEDQTGIDNNAKVISTPSLVSSPKQEMVPEPQNTRKKIFTKIFGKKNIPVAPVVKDTIKKISEPEVIIVKKAPVVQYTWQKVKRLKSINFVYKKVEGLNEKCRQLISTKHGLLAATNRGLFVINDYKTSLIADNYYVNSISWKPFDEKYSVATNDGYFLINYKNGKWLIDIPDNQFSNPVYSVFQTGNNVLWLGGDNVAYKVELGKGPGGVIYKPFSIKNTFPQRYLLSLINDTVFLLTETGVNFYDKTSGGFFQYKTGLTQSALLKGFSYPLSNIPLIRYGDEWIYTEREKQIQERDIILLKLFDEVVSVTAERDNIWVVDDENRLFRIDRKKSSRSTPETTLFIKKVQSESVTSFNLSPIVFNRGDNEITFNIVAPAYLKGNLTQYQYTINKIMTDWSPWSTRTSYNKLIPKSGNYTLLIRAQDLWGNIGDPVSLDFTIKAPFTETPFFYITSIFIALLILFLIVRFRERQLQDKNRILEEKVKERTAEIEAQKGEITSSIEYASRIQMAMLPMNDLFSEYFSEFFIIFKPRDIVSGDFYWIGEDAKDIFLTVADCTGHGVPGAFMSTLGISVLNEIITHNNDLQANTVLNLLREKIKTSLHQTGKEGEAADGMDISLCVFRKDRKSIQYSGAYNPLIIFNGGEFKEYKADRMPIGIHYGYEPSFTNYEINVKQGDAIYILSDGLVDQFGGPDNSKYKKANLKRLLSEIYFRPMAEQKEIIETEFEKWRGRADQVDDITIIGVRI
jgi:serine phosphatase RsbU (regulator of sigma subunit)